MAGAKDAEGVRRAVDHFHSRLPLAQFSIFSVFMFFTPLAIAGLYLEIDDPENTAVIALVAAFLPIAAAFALFDATQVAAAQALRGLKDVRIPMILTGLPTG